MTETAKLIADLEGSERGRYILDVGMAKALGWKCQGALTWRAPGGFDRKLPKFTTNLQDAVDAVPEGFWWEVRQMFGRDSPMRNFGAGNGGLFYARSAKSFGDKGRLGQHNIPALALCIAILKAKEAEND